MYQHICVDQDFEVLKYYNLITQFNGFFNRNFSIFMTSLFKVFIELLNITDIAHMTFVVFFLTVPIQ